VHECPGFEFGLALPSQELPVLELGMAARIRKMDASGFLRATTSKKRKTNQVNKKREEGRGEVDPSFKTLIPHFFNTYALKKREKPLIFTIQFSAMKGETEQR